MKDSTKPNILFIGLFGFPDGMGTSQYIRQLSLGLIRAGCNVRVVIPIFTERVENPHNTRSVGSIDGIDFLYTTGTPIPPTNPFLRKFARIRGKWEIPILLYTLYKRKQVDCVILYGRPYKLLITCQRVCNFLGLPLIAHITEWMESRSGVTTKETDEFKKFHQEVFQRVSGVIAISSDIEHRALAAAESSPKSLPVIRVPVVANFKEWEGVKPAQRGKPYILYCASLDGYLEDALFVVKAFGSLKAPNLSLIMVGKASLSTIEFIHIAAQQQGCEDSIQLYTHYLPNSELNALYVGAQALLAPLHDDEISRARFPSKIAGYLASGVPVVSCKVGEVAQYLADRELAFLSPPDDLQAFSSKISEALTHPRRREIALSGQRIAQEHFDCFMEGQKLADFLKDIIPEK